MEGACVLGGGGVGVGVCVGGGGGRCRENGKKKSDRSILSSTNSF